MSNPIDTTSLEELCHKAREGSAEAERKLIDHLSSDVQRIASSTFSEGLETEDLAQEGLIGLLEAIRDYDLTKNDSFRPFAILCIKRQIKSAQERMLRKKNQPLNDYVSLDLSPEEDGYDLSQILSVEKDNPEKLVLEDDARAELFHRIESLMSPLERQILFLKTQGYKGKDLAKILNITPKSVDNALQRIRKKLESV